MTTKYFKVIRANPLGLIYSSSKICSFHKVSLKFNFYLVNTVCIHFAMSTQSRAWKMQKKILILHAHDWMNEMSRVSLHSLSLVKTPLQSEYAHFFE